MLTVETNFPLALHSLDHTEPHGTRLDNSRNIRFNKRMYGLFPGEKLDILDLGCAGGGFVRDCLDDGHVAIGIEGSDYSKKERRAEWPAIPGNLFTADITKSFIVRENGLPVQFDFITCWEVMEHIEQEGLYQLCENVRHHLRECGWWIMSISPNEEKHHVTVMPKAWWINYFKEQGFEHDEKLVEYFGDEWIRGHNQNAPHSFHLALKVRPK